MTTFLCVLFACVFPENFVRGDPTLTTFFIVLMRGEIPL